MPQITILFFLPIRQSVTGSSHTRTIQAYHDLVLDFSQFLRTVRQMDDQPVQLLTTALAVV